MAIGDEFINSFREESDISLGVSENIFKEQMIRFSIEEFFQVFSVDFDNLALTIRNFLLWGEVKKCFLFKCYSYKLDEIFRLIVSQIRRLNGAVFEGIEEFETFT